MTKTFEKSDSLDLENTISNSVMPSWAKELLGKQEEMQKQIVSLSEENKMLKDIAGKSKAADWRDKQRTFEQKESTFKRRNDKIIIGWDKLDDSKRVSLSRAKSPEEENLFVNVHYHDGTQENLNLSVFNNINDLVKLDIVNWQSEQKRIEDSRLNPGKPTFVLERSATIRLPDGSLKLIKENFLNS